MDILALILGNILQNRVNLKSRWKWASFGRSNPNPNTAASGSLNVLGVQQVQNSNPHIEVKLNQVPPFLWKIPIFLLLTYTQSHAQM